MLADVYLGIERERWCNASDVLGLLLALQQSTDSEHAHLATQQLIKYIVLNAVEVRPNTLARGKKQKDSDTSCKPASHKLTCTQKLIYLAIQYKILLGLV
jgi:hypothetical protein